ncbi:MAG: Sodium:proton antiporter [Thermoleophilia bacterium]|jgi:ATP-binding protein involved in chromosome partitioning|nr:Sodium:proton antiporter [Thermoleophilia bacterium]
MMTRPDRDALLAELRRVQDPELRQDVVTLNMIRDVSCDDDGVVHVHLLLTTPGCPLKASFQEQVNDTVGRLPGVERVELEFGAMDQAQREALRAHLAGDRQHRSPGVAIPDTCRVIAVTSGKGGVGKSTVAANLALALRAQGHEVGILDADVYGYSIPTMLGIHQKPVTVDNMIVPPVAHDVRLMSIGFFLDEDAAVVWRGPMLHRALEQFLGDVHWGALDYVIVDMPPGTGDIAISLGQLLPRAEALIVTTPQHAAQTVARRAALGAMQLDQIVLGIVETMSAPDGEEGIFGSGGGALLAEQLEVPLMASIPLDVRVRVGGDTGVPVAAASSEHAGSDLAARFADLAAAVDARRPAVVVPPPAPMDRIKKPLSLL